MNLKKSAPWLGGLLLVAVVGLVKFTSSNSMQPTNVSAAPSITINQHKIDVEIADDKAERQKGLGERDSLPPDHGMLFIFPVADEHGIWMKGMRFSLDILWLDENKRIIAIVEDFAPETYPEQTVKPDRPAQYVLEVNAGVAKSHGWRVGQTASFQFN